MAQIASLNTSARTAAGPSSSAASDVRKLDVGTTLLKAAWLAIFLGLLMQVLSFVAALLAGGKAQSASEFLRDVTQKVSWSTFVCIGLAVGNGAAKMKPAWVGAIGLLSAPMAFVAARMIQKGMAGALSVAPPDALGTAMFALVLAIKAAEYAILGVAVAWLGQTAWARLRHFTLMGLGVGVVFGIALVVTLYVNSDPRMPKPKIAVQSINEVLFPMGCSLVLYASTVLGKQLRRTA